MLGACAGLQAGLQLLRAGLPGRAAYGAAAQGAASPGSFRLLRHLLQLSAAPGGVHAPAAGPFLSLWLMRVPEGGKDNDT